MLIHTDVVSVALKAAGLDAVLRSEAPCAWDEVWTSLPYQSVSYHAPMINYQNAYFRGAGWVVQDVSLVLRNDGRASGLWLLTLGGPAGGLRLTSAGAAIMAPVFAPGLSPRTIKKICVRAIAFLRSLCAELSLDAPVVEQRTELGPATAEGGGATEWHRQLLESGATSVLRHDLYADLRPVLTDIRASFRKSFRPLINVGLRNWTVFVHDQSNASEAAWAEFKQLHRDVSGRSTRSDETWELQYAMLKAGHAFAVALRDPVDQRLVGAGFFQCTRDEGAYAVGVYDRSLFDKPLGHVVQQRAIEVMKKRGLRWYFIGERHYKQDQSMPTDKQVSIDEFKQGFSSHLFCRFQFHLPLATTGSNCEVSVM